jgi:hypothetical protein
VKSTDRTSLPPGTQVLLEDQGDGWFALAPEAGLPGVIVKAVPAPPRREPAYLVHLESGLELQESGHATPSGLRRRVYDHLLVRSRLQGVALGPSSRVSCDVWLVESVQPLLPTTSDLSRVQPDLWAAVSLLPPER